MHLRLGPKAAGRATSQVGRERNTRTRLLGGGIVECKESFCSNVKERSPKNESANDASQAMRPTSDHLQGGDLH